MARSDSVVNSGLFFSPDSIMLRIAMISPFLLIFFAPIAILQPIPFYVWDPPFWIGGPPTLIDILIGFGGLMNQLLFVFYFFAIIIWIRSRNYFGIFVCFFLFMFFNTLNLIGLGQVRQTMAHLYPIYYFSIAFSFYELKMRSVKLPKKIFLIGFLFFSSLYFTYLAFKFTNSILALVLFSLIPISIFIFLLKIAAKVVKSEIPSKLLPFEEKLKISK